MNKKPALIIILVLVVLILGGGAYYYYFFFMKDAVVAPGGEQNFPGTGNNPPPTFPPPVTPPPVNPGTGQTSIPIIRQIGEKPVLAAVAIDSSATDVTLRYIERGTSFVYEASAFAPTIIETRIANKTIPRIEEAQFTNTGNSLILRYSTDNIEDIATNFVTIKRAATSTGEGDLVGAFLPAGITSLSLSPAKDSIFYTTTQGGKTIGVRAGTDGSKRTQVFSSDLREWTPQWFETNAVALASKSSFSANGYLSFLNVKTGVTTPVINAVTGLTTLVNPLGTYVITAESVDTTLTTSIFNVKTKTSSSVPLKTLPEKCVWSKKSATVAFCAVPRSLPVGNYPDAWYLGLVTFSDDIWRVDAETGMTERIVAVQDLIKRDLDLVDPILDRDEKVLLYRNKKDSTLWSVVLAK